MKIPKEIKVGWDWYKVESPKHIDRKAACGSVNYSRRVIEVATHCNIVDVRYRKDQRAETFWHELTHAILEDMGSHLEGDEDFVESFSSRLSRAINSARF